MRSKLVGMIGLLDIYLMQKPVRVAHDETKQRYGCERLHTHLAEQGHHISQYMVRQVWAIRRQDR
ncbi:MULTISPECIES: hypothetical protein [unclassified Psychrobacter]|uniref:hypothetical protein n=1 Tax=unclassified Psychrobacter TaxID=196806 RepID=UPI003F460554